MLAMRCPASLGKVPVAAERKFGRRRGMVDDVEQTAESLAAFWKSSMARAGKYSTNTGACRCSGVSISF
jgi:hypothetical protein